MIGILLTNLLLAWPVGLLYKKASKKPIFKQKFWQVLCRCLGSNAVEEWRKVEQLPPSSLIRNMEEFLWQYTPGLFLTIVFGLMSFLTWFIISMTSKLFAVVLIFWILIYLCNKLLSKHRTKFQRRRMPTEEVKKALLDILKVIKFNEKGVYSFLTILVGLAYSCLINYTSLSILIARLNTFILFRFQLFYFLLLLFEGLLSVYQFIFWYVIIKRFPSFIMLWTDRSKIFCVKAVPTGGLASFGLSCILMILLHYIDTLSLYNPMAVESPILWIFLTLIGSFSVLIILYSVKRWNRKVTKDIDKDNYRIPLATIISSISVSYMYATPPLPSLNSAILAIYIPLLIVGMFYIPDLRKFLLTRYPKIFRDHEIFDIFLIAIFALFVLPIVFLVSEISHKIFVCVGVSSLFALSIYCYLLRKALENNCTDGTVEPDKNAITLRKLTEP